MEHVGKLFASDAVRSFAGKNSEKPVVEAGAAAALTDFDAEIRHYEVIEDVPAPRDVLTFYESPSTNLKHWACEVVPESDGVQLMQTLHDMARRETAWPVWGVQ